MLEYCKRLTVTGCICILSLLPLSTHATTTTHTHTNKKHAHSHTHKKAVSKIKKVPIPSANASIQQGIDQIINSFGHGVNIGVIVQSTANGATLYQRGANHLFVPASTMKLFTATAALTYLNPNSVFTTQFFSQSKPQNGVINGNLYARFSGDPLLTVNHLKTMIDILSQDGVRIIQGDLVIDDTALDQDNWAPGWLWNDQILCYAAPATSVILNRNCFGVHFAANKSPNAPAQVKIYDYAAHVSIINEVVTRHAKHQDCAFGMKAAGNNTYLVKGCLAPHHPPLSLSVALNNPRHAAAGILTNLLKEKGIVLNGSVKYSKTPPNPVLLVEHDSPPLHNLITRMLKKSDNLIADTIFKKLGATYFHTTGTWSNGAQAVRAILTNKAGVNFNNITMVDGAGLSRYDSVSPASFAQLLNYAYRVLPANTIFYQALPKSGVDGTLKHRLGGITLGKVHAKTGTMTDTSGLAGYVETQNHQTYIFAILINGFNNRQATYHLIEDRICQFLAKK